MAYFTINPYIGTPYCIEYNSTTSLSGITGLDLLYEKPDGTTGATALTSTGNTFLISIPAIVNDTHGLWRLQPRAYYAADTTPSLWSAFTVYVRKMFR
jgi:hypothetical protein